MAYKSKLEKYIAEDLENRNIKFEYESLSFTYEANYKPDFVFIKHGFICEAKGYHPNFKAALTKLIRVKKSNPDLDIRICWEKANLKISKTLTAAKWSEKHGFPYCEKTIPEEWLK